MDLGFASAIWEQDRADNLKPCNLVTCENRSPDFESRLLEILYLASRFRLDYTVGLKEFWNSLTLEFDSLKKLSRILTSRVF